MRLTAGRGPEALRDPAAGPVLPPPPPPRPGPPPVGAGTWSRPHHRVRGPEEQGAGYRSAAARSRRSPWPSLGAPWQLPWSTHQPPRVKGPGVQPADAPGANAVPTPAGPGVWEPSLLPLVPVGVCPCSQPPWGGRVLRDTCSVTLVLRCHRGACCGQDGQSRASGRAQAASEGPQPPRPAAPGPPLREAQKGGSRVPPKEGIPGTPGRPLPRPSRSRSGSGWGAGRCGGPSLPKPSPPFAGPPAREGWRGDKCGHLSGP